MKITARHRHPSPWLGASPVLRPALQRPAAARRQAMPLHHRRPVVSQHATCLVEPPVDLDELNDALAALDWCFCSSRDARTLQVNNGCVIRFPLRLEGVGEPVRHRRWLDRKHRNGSVHEPATVAVLAALAPRLPPGADVFDVGALFGYFSLVAASLLPDATIHAFEGNPSSVAITRAIVESNAALSPRVRTVPKAVSDRSALAVAVDFHGLVLDEGQGEELVDFVSVDDYTAESRSGPALLKIDVEGFQAKVVPGAMRTLATHRPVVALEFDELDKLARFRVTNRDVVAPIVGMGYRLFWTGDHRGLSSFTEVSLSNWSDEYERNSLGVLVPE